MQEIVQRATYTTRIVAHTTLAVLALISLGVYTVAWKAETHAASVAAAPVVRTSGAKVEPLITTTECVVAVGDEGDLPLACTADEALGIWWSQYPSDGLRVRLVVQAIEGQWRPVMVVRPTKAGKWSLSAARASADGKLFASSVTIATSELEPSPDPTPSPTPPSPNTPKQVAILIESDRLDDLPAAQRDIVASLSARKRITDAGHLFAGVFDPDQQDAGKGKLPTWIAQFTNEARLGPIIVVAPRQGGAPTSKPLPPSIDALLESL